ncbi:ThiJ/PfpI [Kalaharituber pfeilii]|nr:ThiJ/PfpI [Kalaharituber pfeilii]
MQFPISVGVLLLDFHQYLDQAGPVDLLSSLTPAYLSYEPNLPAPPIPFQFHYITTHPTLEPVNATGGPSMNPTHTLATCPKLDVLLIPGPEPTFTPSTELKDFLIAKYEESDHVLTVCTGALVLARTGVLRGKNAASNKMALKTLASANATREELRSHGVNWARSGRWVRDGKVWSSAGVTAGMDMASAWLSTSKAEGGLGVHLDLLKLAWTLSEWTPRAQDDDEFAYVLDGVEL